MAYLPILVVLSLGVSLCLLSWKKLGNPFNFFFILKSVSTTPHPVEHIVGNIYRISYLHQDRKYYLYFPIRDTPEDRDVFLLHKGQTISLKQQTGVPYSILPSDGDGEIIVMSEDDCNLTFQGIQNVRW